MPKSLTQLQLEAEVAFKLYMLADQQAIMAIAHKATREEEYRQAVTAREAKEIEERA